LGANEFTDKRALLRAPPDAEGTDVPVSPPLLDNLGFPLDPFPALELGVDADGVFIHHAGAVGAS